MIGYHNVAYHSLALNGMYDQMVEWKHGFLVLQHGVLQCHKFRSEHAFSSVPMAPTPLMIRLKCIAIICNG